MREEGKGHEPTGKKVESSAEQSEEIVKRCTRLTSC
jgi:hypothetical protein